MKILIIDNFDSFTFNLYQYVGGLTGSGHNVTVRRNNEISVPEIRSMAPDRILLSPGPGHPADEAYFGVCKDIVLDIGRSVPTLGVCLGMQGMGYYSGARVGRLMHPVHGKTSLISHDGRTIFSGLPQDLEVMRYHSLIVEESGLPACLEVSARSQDGIIMGLRHREYPMEGVQFHPESFATEGGVSMLKTFLYGHN